MRMTDITTIRLRTPIVPERQFWCRSGRRSHRSLS